MFEFRQTVKFLIYYDSNWFLITDINAFMFTSWIGLFKDYAMLSDIVDDIKG